MSDEFSTCLWGAATAAFQVEGGATADGRGPSIWDVYCAIPGKTVAGDTGQVACDHYHRWQDDVALMQAMKLQAYRLSISWPRVKPAGRGVVSERGLDFYDRLIDGLRAAGIEPFVTLYHWDLPAALQFEMNGWLHPDLPHVFADYAELMFERLGDRVTHWITLNEPWVCVDAGYFHGTHPPGVKDRGLGYVAGHNLLRGHAYAVERFRRSAIRDGKISFALNTTYSFPASSTTEDAAAAERSMLNFAGWFGDPVWFGDYPAVMRERLGALLPEFSAEDARLLRKSIDYIALNYYFSDVVRYRAGAGPMDAELIPQTQLPQTSMPWPIMPDGLYHLLLWLHRRYDGLPICITENGACFEDRPDANGFVDDQPRISYLREHFAAARRAVAEGVRLDGYLVWSLIDNLEWSQGFSKRFGLIRCDHATQQRTIKASGKWFADWIARGGRE